MLNRWVRPENYGWVVVPVAALTMAVGFGSLISVSVFLKSLEAEFGWARGDTSFAYSSAAFLAGFCGIFMGRLVDRVSARPLVLVGAVSLGLANVLLSRLDSLWELYVYYGLLVGALANAAFLTPLVANVSFWFERNKGVAMGCVMAGQSLGAAVMPFIARLLIEGLGWRQAYLVLGAGATALLVPLALLLREPPGLAAAREQARADEQRGTGALLIGPTRLTAVLCTAIIFCCICMVIPMLHVFPLALEGGLAAPAAASVLSLMMGVSIIGRIGVGKVAEYTGGVGSLLLASGIQTLMIFWFTQVGSLAGFYAVAIAFGVGYGGVIPSYAIIVRELIPAHKVGSSMGFVFFFGNLGMATGGWLAGVLYDWSGAYPLSFGTGAVAGMVNLTIVGTLLLYLRSRQAALQPVAHAA